MFLNQPRTNAANPKSRAPAGQSALQKQANQSPRHQNIQQLQQMADNNAGPMQRMTEEKIEQHKAIQRAEAPAPMANNTGLPDKLKSGVETLSGMSLDNVKVHYNSSKPAAVQAHAYAQGSDIHLASGQEKHLPHEAWHVVQQAQGRVTPTTQMKGVAINDDAGLEKEADVMGARALATSATTQTKSLSDHRPPTGPVQRMKVEGVDTESSVSGTTAGKHVKATGDQQAAAQANFGSTTFVTSNAILTAAVDADDHDFPSSSSRSDRHDINANVAVYLWNKTAAPGTPGFRAGGAVTKAIDGQSTSCEIGAVKTGDDDISITHFKKN